MVMQNILTANTTFGGNNVGTSTVLQSPLPDPGFNTTVATDVFATAGNYIDVTKVVRITKNDGSTFDIDAEKLYNAKQNDELFDPTATNDNSEDYEVNSLWVNTATDEVFILVDDTVGAAIWVPVTAKPVEHLFITDTLMAPAVLGAPTVAEAFAAAGGVDDVIIHYNATDTETDNPTYAWRIDEFGDIIEIKAPVAFEGEVFELDWDPATALPTAFGDAYNYVIVNVGTMTADVDISGWVPTASAQTVQFVFNKTDTSRNKLIWTDPSTTVTYNHVNKRGESISMIWNQTINRLRHFG